MRPLSPIQTNVPRSPSLQENFADPIDPSIEFLYKPHSLTALVITLITLIYYAFSVPEIHSNQLGFFAALGLFLFFCVLAFKDGPFIRPHPAFWRLVMAAGLAYQLGLTFLLFQKVEWAREFLRLFIDSNLGVALPEKSYAEDCSLNFTNVMGKMDEFVIAHILGWYAKAIIIRDFWFCWILSIMFEICEYSLQHHLSNFAECWWDHWILDVLVCNLLGTYLGMRTCDYFEMKTYSWRGIREIPGVRGKMKRAMEQFTPHSWEKFDWGTTKSLKNFLAVILLLIAFLLCELNAFYLKYILWVPPAHWLNTYRVFLYFLCGIPATREAYQYLSDSLCKRIGIQAWLVVVMVCTEVLICIKFGSDMFPEPFPLPIIIFWTTFLAALVGYAIFHFGIPATKEFLKNNAESKSKKLS
ncbi:hypothetical protein HMI54_014859 [Coelomomyces lativittatus]|nr:hypothetical protein HMI56_002251 [Coelomomyces lativittatus]KAJ1513602.1 hypothetical protein HMI54_014859 [Coelomomyces lativittatus]